jgi:predicted Zn-dependent peptidase
VTIDELKKMTSDITEKEITTAKAQIKSSLLMSMESSGSRAEKLANNIATFGRIISNEEIVQKINEVDIDAVQKCIKSLLSSSEKCTVVGVGQIDNLQSYDEIIKRLDGESL